MSEDSSARWRGTRGERGGQEKESEERETKGKDEDQRAVQVGKKEKRETYLAH